MTEVSDTARPSHSLPQTSSALQLSLNKDNFLSEYAEAPLCLTLLLQTSLSLSFFVDHCFTTAQLICDFTTLLIKRISLHQEFHSEVNVKVIAHLLSCHMINKRNSLFLIEIAQSFHLSV